MLNKSELRELYSQYSAAQIAKIKKCSVGQVNYWLERYWIKKRSISEAIYKKHNPNSDPFSVKAPKNLREAFIFGLGIGLYWGEGTKSNKLSIRLGNTDPTLIRYFIRFLEIIYGINKDKLRYGLQIFNDINPKAALGFWRKILSAKYSQFQKVVVSSVRGIGTYKNKSKYGVLTLYYNNKKLRDILCGKIENLRLK